MLSATGDAHGAKDSLARRHQELFESSVRELEEALVRKEEENKGLTQQLQAMAENYNYNYNLVQERDEELAMLEDMTATVQEEARQRTDELQRVRSLLSAEEERVHALESRVTDLSRELEQSKAEASAEANRAADDLRAREQQLHDAEEQARADERRLQAELRQTQTMSERDASSKEREWAERTESLRAELAAARARTDAQQERLADLQQLLEGAEEKARAVERENTSASAKHREAVLEFERKLKTFQRDAEEETDKARASEAARRKAEERSGQLQKSLGQSEAARREELKRFEAHNIEQETAQSKLKQQIFSLQQEVTDAKRREDETAVQLVQTRNESEAQAERQRMEDEVAHQKDSELRQQLARAEGSAKAKAEELFRLQRTVQQAELDLQTSVEAKRSRESEAQHYRQQAETARAELISAREELVGVRARTKDLEERTKEEEHRRRMAEDELRVRCEAVSADFAEDKERWSVREAQLSGEASRLRAELRRSEQLRLKESEERELVICELERSLAGKREQRQRGVSKEELSSIAPSHLQHSRHPVHSSPFRPPHQPQTEESRTFAFAAPLQLDSLDTDDIVPVAVSPFAVPGSERGSVQGEVAELRRRNEDLERRNTELKESVKRFADAMESEAAVDRVRSMEEEIRRLEAVISKQRQECAELQLLLQDKDREHEEMRARASQSEGKAVMVLSAEVTELQRQLADERRRSDVMRSFADPSLLSSTGEVSVDHIRGAMSEASRIRAKHDKLRREYKLVLQQNGDLREKLRLAVEELNMAALEAERLRGSPNGGLLMGSAALLPSQL